VNCSDAALMDVGRGAGGTRPPWILKIAEKKVVF